MTTDGDGERAEAYRAELRSWLARNYTGALASVLDGPSHPDRFRVQREWNTRLFDAGHAAVAWPVRFGGRDAGIRQQLAGHEEMARVGAPGPVNAIGVANIAPAIMTFGTDDQKERFLRPMLRGDEIWSQGMSEPEAGSDLASLRCRGVVDGDRVLVNGQKTWNSNGDRADWCQLYVRTDTDVPKHQGISCLLVDMDIAGIEARPITSMAGDRGFSELFLTDVRVPLDALLGEIDGGWAVATRTLSNERAGVAPLYLQTRRTFERLLAAATEPGTDGSRPIDDPVRRDRLMACFEDVRNLEFLARRMLGAAMSGRPPGPEGSVMKLAWSETGKRVAETAAAILGPGTLSGPWSETLLSSRALSIAGGTTEVNKNIIAERVLQLPREPRVRA